MKEELMVDDEEPPVITISHIYSVFDDQIYPSEALDKEESYPETLLSSYIEISRKDDSCLTLEHFNDEELQNNI